MLIFRSLAKKRTFTGGTPSRAVAIMKWFSSIIRKMRESAKKKYTST